MSKFASSRGASVSASTQQGPALHLRSPLLDAPSHSLRSAPQQPSPAASRRTSTQASASGSGMRQLPSPSSSSTPSTPSPATAAPLTPAAPAPRISYRVSFFDAMKFNGPAPELINGRLAMVGLLQAAIQESEGGQTVLEQLSHISLGTCLVIGLWVYASMVPLLKGVKQEAFGPFSPRAELTNGRAAMLGFAVLCALEYSAGVPFF